MKEKDLCPFGRDPFYISRLRGVYEKYYCTRTAAGNHVYKTFRVLLANSPRRYFAISPRLCSSCQYTALRIPPNNLTASEHARI